MYFIYIYIVRIYVILDYVCILICMYISQIWTQPFICIHVVLSLAPKSSDVLGGTNKGYPHLREKMGGSYIYPF